jgi:hypothetical protein
VRSAALLLLITEMAGRRFELSAPNIHNKAQIDSITPPHLHSEKERHKEVLNSRVSITAHKKLRVSLT